MHSLLSRQAFEHEADHGQAHEGDSGACITFELPRQPSTMTDPCEPSLHDSALGQDDKAMHVGAFDDLDLPAPCVNAPWLRSLRLNILHRYICARRKESGNGSASAGHWLRACLVCLREELRRSAEDRACRRGCGACVP